MHHKIFEIFIGTISRARELYKQNRILWCIRKWENSHFIQVLEGSTTDQWSNNYSQTLLSFSKMSFCIFQRNDTFLPEYIKYKRTHSKVDLYSISFCFQRYTSSIESSQARSSDARLGNQFSILSEEKESFTISFLEIEYPFLSRHQLQLHLQLLSQWISWKTNLDELENRWEPITCSSIAYSHSDVIRTNGSENSDFKVKNNRRNTNFNSETCGNKVPACRYCLEKTTKLVALGR